MTTSIILLTLLRTTLFLGVGGLVCWLVLRRISDRVPHLSRVLWLAVLLSGWFWVRPMIAIPYSQTAINIETQIATPTEILPPNMPPMQHEMMRPFDAAQDVTQHIVSNETAVAEMPLEKMDWKPLILSTLFAVWLGGMVVSIFLAATGYLQFLLRLRKTVPASDDFAGPWRQLLDEHGINSRTIPMLVSGCDASLGPALIRTVRGYRLVVPRELWSELSEAGRCGILKHELAHFHRRDVWKSFFVRVLALPHWFNPIAHLAVHRFEEAAEQLCDRAAFDLQQEGVLEFARTLLLLHENAPTRFVARQSIFGRGLQHRVACLLHENPKRKVSLMKKITILTAATILLAACLFQFEFVEKTVALAVTNDAPAVKEVTQTNDVPAGQMSAEGQLAIEMAKSARDHALAEVNGDISTGTLEQQMKLVGATQEYGWLLRTNERMEEAREIARQLLVYHAYLKKIAEQAEEPETKQWISHAVANAHTLFAMCGMYDEAVEAARASIAERQYNASEYLVRVAKLVTHYEGFKRAIPILDEALVAANKLPDESWWENAIIGVAKVYAEVGRDAKARELITPLSHERQASGLLALYTIAKKKNRPESELTTLLKDAETAAELADRLNKPDVTKWELESLYNVALTLAQSGKINEATAIFEKTSSANVPHLQDEFLSYIGYYWYEQGNLVEMETYIDKMTTPTSKTKILLSLLHKAKRTENRETMKRLIEKTEPLLEEVTTPAYRWDHLLRLAAYKMMIDKTEEGRRMMDELLEADYEADGLERDWILDRAVTALCRARLYDEAKKRIEMMSSESWKASAYESLQSLYLDEEEPERYKERVDHWNISEEDDR